MNFSQINTVFFDIDGTFLNDQSQPFTESLPILDQLIDKGIDVIPCTGRGFAGVANVPGLVERASYVICYDGGQIYQKNQRGNFTILRQLSIPEVAYRELLEMFDYSETSKFALVVFQGPHMWLNIMPPGGVDYLKTWGGNPQIIRSDQIASLKDVQLLLLYSDHQNMAPVEKKIMTSFADNLNIIGYESAKIEVRGLIMKSGKSHKGEGLQFMMNHLQRPIEYSLGIGDWLNDLSMIETAGIGVAMKNACDELKNKADVMTNYDNNHGGMVRFLADNLL